jgi:hypothetical protein
MVAIQQLHSMETPPFPLSSRPKRSAVAVMKNGCYSATTLHGSAALPFVISTEAKRSGGDEKWLLFSNYTPWKRRLPFVISTEAKHSGEISVWMLFLGNVFRHSGMAWGSRKILALSG